MRIQVTSDKIQGVRYIRVISLVETYHYHGRSFEPRTHTAFIDRARHSYYEQDKGMCLSNLSPNCTLTSLLNQLEKSLSSDFPFQQPIDHNIWADKPDPNSFSPAR